MNSFTQQSPSGDGAEPLWRGLPPTPPCAPTGSRAAWSDGTAHGFSSSNHPATEPFRDPPWGTLGPPPQKGVGKDVEPPGPAAPSLTVRLSDPI